MPILPFLLLNLFAFSLAILRVFLTDSTYLFSLVWNLVLAMIPYFFAYFFIGTKKSSLRWIFFLGWMLFLPNSFYIVTDFIHLHYSGFLAFDMIFILTCAIIGIIAGFASIDLVRDFFSRKNHARIGWSITIFALFLSMVGIYIGRFLRFNSWDIFTDPIGIVREISASILSNGLDVAIGDERRLFENEIFSVGMMGMWQFILLYGTFFLILYFFWSAMRGEKVKK